MGKALSRKGRKRKEGVREPNGRLSRKAEHVAQREAETEKQVMSTAIEARQRVYGLTEAQATANQGNTLRPNAGTVIGRLTLTKELSLIQYAAARRYVEVRMAYHRAILAHTDESDGGARRGMEEDSDAYAAWCRRSIDAYKEMREAIQETQNSCRGNILAAFSYMIDRDEYHEHFQGDLRIGLNSLARLWGLDKSCEAA